VDEYLFPARHVAEYAYCPRLFYLMEVEGIFAPSVDTEKGNQVHRRVHRPGQEPTDDEPKAVRSLSLTSQRLGLTATLDLAEIDGNRAVPIEYRKGRPRDPRPDSTPSVNGSDGSGNPAPETTTPPSYEQAWPTDRVQVGLQAILLEEAGYEVPEVDLYYAEARRHVRLPVTDALREEALRCLRDAKACAAGPRPLPLVNDPKCPRCSLQPICLPDEVNHQRASGTDPDQSDAEDSRDLRAPTDARPRALVPLSDDGIHLVAQQDGVRIGVRGLTLHVTDRDGIETSKIPITQVQSLAILGGVQLSTQALHALADQSTPVAFMTSAGRLVAMLDPLDSVSATVRREQVRAFDDPARKLELARALVQAKIINQRVLLQRNGQNVPADALDELLRQANAAENASEIQSLLGHEGQAAAVYFDHFASMIRSDLAAEFDRNGRQRRPPPDPINATLSFAYTMLTHECVSALRLARLEPTLGALHTSRPGRPALACDLVEPFRPLIAESVTLSLFSRGELTEGHFLRTAAGCALTDAGRRAFFQAWARRMDTVVTHPVFEYRLSYRRMLMLHARMISAWILREIPTLAFLTTR
jgi:CRISPR-associated protein Cas1